MVSALVTIIGVSYLYPEGSTFTVDQIRQAATEDMKRFTGSDTTLTDSDGETTADD